MFDAIIFVDELLANSTGAPIDLFIEVNIFVTDTEKGSEVSDNSEPQNTDKSESSDDREKSDNSTVSDNTNVPVTGDGYPIVIVLLIMVSFCIAVLAARKRTDK